MGAIGYYAYLFGLLVVTYLDIIGIVLGSVLGSITLGVLVVYCAIKFIMSDMMAGTRKYLVFKYNGFVEARRVAKGRPRPIKKVKPPKVEKEISEEEKIHILDFVAIIWEFMKAIYKGVCPMLEFTEAEKVQDVKEEES